MNSKSEKRELPPYASYASFRTFLNKLAEDGLPARIDKSLMPTFSGGQQSAILATLRWFGLIDDEGKPSDNLKKLTSGDEDSYKDTMAEVIEQSYPFLRDGSLELSNATTQQVEDKFKTFGIQGSTITKSIAFFLQAARDAGIVVSKHVRAPKPPRSNGSKGAGSRKKRRSKSKEPNNEFDAAPEKPRKDMVKITVPLHGLPDGEIFFPEGMGSEQWTRALKMAQLILENYRPSTEED